MDSEHQLFAPFAKIDRERREVYGYATTPTRDQSGESVDLMAVKAALPSYLQYPAVREMHQPSAVGTGIEANLDQKGLWFGAKVIDDQAWRKVAAGVYRGFSVGGRVTKRDHRDPKHILGIDLTEISLVDRPCNPDARFELIKMEGESCVLAKGVKSVAGGRIKTGRFASLQQLHQEATGEQLKHEDLAAESDKDAARHGRKTDSAIDAKDKDAVALHSAMAHTSASMANHHREIAGRYKEIATHLMPEGAEEDMPDNELQKLIDKATASIDDLAKQVGSDGHGSGKNARIEGMEKALEHGHEMSANSIASIASAMRAKANANAARVSEPDKTKHHSAEAAASMTSAHAAHVSASDSYKTFEGHLKTPAGTSQTREGSQGEGKVVAEPNVEGQKLKEHNLIKALRVKLAKQCTDNVTQLRKAADEFIGMAKKEGTPDDEAAEMKETAANIHKMADEEERVAKLGNEVDALKDNAGVDNSSDGEIVAKVVKTSKLTKFGDAWFDKRGNFFGKRAFTDDKRKELAGSGAAMPDGSFPIETKSDLENAVGLRGNSKHPKDKVEAHIRSRAKAIGEPVPESMGKADGIGDGDEDDKKTAGDFGGKKAAPFGAKDTDKKDDDEAMEKRACAKCGGMNKAGDMKCAACGTSMTKVADKDDVKCAADLAATLRGVRRLTKRANLPASADLAKWLSDGNKLLVTAVAEKMMSVMKGPEMPSAEVFAKAAPDALWMKTAVSVLLSLGEGLSPVQHDTRVVLAKSMKKLRKKIKKDAEAQKEKEVDAIEKRVAEELKKVAPSSDGAMDAMQKLIARIAPLAKSAQDMKLKLDAKDAEVVSLNDRLAKLESQPLNNGGGKKDKNQLAKAGLIPISKEEDGRSRQDAPYSEEPSPLLTKILAVPAGSQRAEALLRSAYTPRSR